MTWTGDVNQVKEVLEEWDMCESKVAETPGVTGEPEVQSSLNADCRSMAFAAQYRRPVAKLNYLALDNPTIAVSSRLISSCRQGQEVKLKRTLRFWRKQPTTTYRYVWQGHPGAFD